MFGKEINFDRFVRGLIFMTVLVAGYFLVKELLKEIESFSVGTFDENKIVEIETELKSYNSVVAENKVVHENASFPILMPRDHFSTCGCRAAVL